MPGAIDNSVRAAYAIFGDPAGDRHPSCLSKEKWINVSSFAMHYLGFYIARRQMIMAWPVDKHTQLASLLDDLFQQESCIVTLKESSSLLGLIHNAAPVAPLRVFLSLCIQYALNEGIQGVWQQFGLRVPAWWRKWYRQSGLLLQQHTLQDLKLLWSTLDSNYLHPAWS